MVKHFCFDEILRFIRHCIEALLGHLENDNGRYAFVT